MEIHAKAEITILFLHKEHRGSMQRMAWTYKSDTEMLVQKLVQFAEFRLQQRIDCTRWRFGTFHKVDL